MKKTVFAIVIITVLTAMFISSCGTVGDTETPAVTDTAASVTATSEAEAETATEQTETTATESATEQTETAAQEPCLRDFIDGIMDPEKVDEALKNGRYVSSSIANEYLFPSQYSSLEWCKYRLYSITNLPEGYVAGKYGEDDNNSKREEYRGDSTFYLCVFKDISYMRSTYHRFMSRWMNKYSGSLYLITENDGAGVSVSAVCDDEGIVFSYTVAYDENGDLRWEYIQKRYLYGLGAYLFRYDLEMPCAYAVSDGGPSLEELLDIELYHDPIPEEPWYLGYLVNGGGYLGCQYPDIERFISAFTTGDVRSSWIDSPSLYGCQLSFEYLDGADPDRFMYLKGLPSGSEIMGVEWCAGSSYSVYFRLSSGETLFLHVGVDYDDMERSIEYHARNSVERKEIYGEDGTLEYVYIKTRSYVNFFNFKSDILFSIKFILSADTERYDMDYLIGLELVPDEVSYVPDDKEFMFFENADGTLAIVRYYGDGGTVVIPEEVDGKTVTRIGKNAFDHNQDIVRVILPESISSIDARAFENCTSLVSINIPEGIKKIEYFTFSGCRSLSDLVLPDSLVEIERGAFSGLAINSLTIPKGVTAIRGSAFMHCRDLVSVCFEDGGGALTIGDYAFEDCHSLDNVVLPDTVVSVGRGAFGRCTSLTSVRLPAGLRTVPEYLFRDCTSLVSVVMPTGRFITVTSTAFEGCTALDYDSLVIRRW